MRPWRRLDPHPPCVRIAVNYGVTVAAIIAANGIANPNLMRSGQAPVIPTRTPTSGPPATPPSASPVRYTVKSGDTLYRIAVNHGVTVAAIMAADGIANPNLISPGQVLVIPTSASPATPPTASPVRYTVKSGDTLYRIAVNHGVTVAAIMAANGIAQPQPHLPRPGALLDELGPSWTGARRRSASWYGSSAVSLDGGRLARSYRTRRACPCVEWRSGIRRWRWATEAEDQIVDRHDVAMTACVASGSR